MEVKNKSWPCHITMNFEQMNLNQLFCRKNGLAVMLSIPRRTTIKNVDEIISSAQENYNHQIVMNVKKQFDAHNVNCICSLLVLNL